MPAEREASDVSDPAMTSAVAANTSAPPSRRPPVVRLLVGAAALAAIGFGLHWALVGRYEVSTNNAHVRADITHIAPRVGGYVASLEASDNQPVKAGDLLFRLESRDYAVKVAEAEAVFAQAEADLAQANSHIDVQRATITYSQGQAQASRNQVEAADANADLSRADAERYRELADAGWFPRARLESAEAEKRSADAALRAQQSEAATADAAVNRSRRELTAAEAAAEAAEARVSAAAARLEAARLDLERTEIRAPIDGVVGNRNVAVGQLLQPGQAALSIVPVSEAYVIANFKETQVAKMRPGQPVRIKVDAYPGLDVNGRVESLAPATGSTFSLIPQDTATGNFTKIVQRIPVRIALDETAMATGLMRSGLAVEVTVVTRKTDPAPREAATPAPQ
jgi:membrane fusion protein, multidrug efflux system